MEIRALGPGDDAAVRAARNVFDYAPEEAATRRFLAEPGHHLLVAYENGEPAGFVSGVELTHPDKGTEMFLYELGVDERFRQRGIGRALVDALRDLAVGRGCYGMFVLTDDDNVAARATYSGAGGVDPSPQLMLSWSFGRQPGD
jgi:ribosomal protein S18 acetylase RimI-like enzyme